MLKINKKSFFTGKLPLLILPIIFFGLLYSGCVQLGKMAAQMMTTKTSKINDAAVQVMYVSNLYPADAGTTETDFFEKEWRPGRSFVSINFVKRKGVGFYEINGEVKVNNEPLKHIANGFYGKFVDTVDNNPQTFRVTTTTGEDATFSVDPPKPVSIISVNGKKENAEVNMNSPLTIEFADFQKLAKDEKVRVSFLMDVLGVRTFVDVGIFKPVKKLTIPPEAFKHTAVSSSMKGFTNFKPGKNYLRVERFSFKKGHNPNVGASQIISEGWAWSPIKITEGAGGETGISIESPNKKESGFSYKVNKPNAFSGKPLFKAKKFALTSLSVRGVLKTVTKETSEHYGFDNTVTITTTTRTWQFPQLPDSFWEQLMSNVYKDLEKVLKAEYNITLIPVEKVVKSPSYAALEPIEDENTEVKIAKSYKGTKNLLPTSLGKMVSDISSTFASDRPDSRMMDELDVDGLISVTLDLAVPKNTEFVLLNPIMAIRMTGLPNGYVVGPTVYYQGIVHGTGVPFSEAEFANINALNKIIRKDDLIGMFKKSLQDLAKKEKEEGYEAIWKLQ